MARERPLLGVWVLVLVACGGSQNGSGDGAPGGVDATVNPNDRDNDGWGNDSDNCPDVANADQLDWDTDGQGDPCDPDPPPETCGDALVASARIAPVILVVLDRSLSMDQNNKWTDAKAALDQLSTAMADQLRLGLALFSGGGQDMCSPAELILPVGSYTASDFQQSYANEDTSGATPLRIALERVRTENWLSDPDDTDFAKRSKNVLLVTDGMPNCADGHEGDYQYYDNDAVLAEANLLRQTGAFIYVVGFGDGVDGTMLNNLAAAGGTDNPDNPDNRYFDANSGQDLQNALMAIGALVGSCTLTLEGWPADSTRIYVTVAGSPVVRDSADGFVYHGSDNTIELKGAACEAAKAGQPVQVIFGCPPDGGPPIIVN